MATARSSPMKVRSTFPASADAALAPSAALPGWPLRCAVMILILLAAASLFQQFQRVAPSLWYSVEHDRNGHYSRSQNIALALRAGDVGGLIREFHASTVWPPLHPFLTGVVLAIGGLDYRLAVLSSLGAWVAACWFVFALAARLAPCSKGWAGCVALLFALACPAYRAYAVDIMIESLGAALTLATLYFYVAARQERSAWRGRCFALLLLALFLAKYNYWTLLVAGLCLGAAWEFRRPLLAAMRARLQSSEWLRWTAAQLRHPLTYLLLPAFGLALYIEFVSGLQFTLLGRAVQIESLAFPAELCYVLLLIRIFPWWLRSGRQAAALLPVPNRELVHWLVYPLALWFLWPQRLSIFLWSVTYTHHGRVAESSPWFGSLNYYWQCLTQDYHANSTALVLVLALIAVAVLCQRRWVTGTTVVFGFLLVAALLTNYHSANRSRFLHSWLAVGWAGAGVGAALGAERLAEWGRSLGAGDSRLLVPALSGLALVGLVMLQRSALVGPGHAQEGGPQPDSPNLLALADEICPELARARQPVLVSNAPFELLLDWRVREQRGDRRRLQVAPRELLPPASQEQFEAWLRQSSRDLVLLIDAPNSLGGDVTHLRSLLASSGDFSLVSQWDLPESKTTAQVWRAAHADPERSHALRTSVRGGEGSLRP